MANLCRAPSLFRKFEKDSQGTVSTTQLGMAMRSLGLNVSKEDLQAMINRVDPDKKGTIAFPEFLMLMANRVEHDVSEEEIREAFKAFDRNGSGHISGSELRHIMQNLGQKLTDNDFLLDEMMAEADKDGDGEIDYEEFLSIMTLKH